MSIPADRVVRNVDEESAISLDIALYGDAYVRGEIPAHWGALWRHIEQQLVQQISQHEDVDTLRA
jgi:hypothetical protein